MIKEALEYISLFGVSVIPLRPDDKKPFYSLLPKDERGKSVWKPYQTRHPTTEEINRWWTKEPSAMIGIVMGKISNLVAIDVDSNDAQQKFTSVVPASIWTNCPLVKTPRGYHYYFRYEEGIRNTVNVSGEMMDIRGEGGYVVAPPSVTKDGVKYEWINPLKIDPPSFPEEFKNPERYRTDTQLTQDTPPEETFVEGRRDEDLFHVAHQLIRSKMPEDQVKNIVMRLALTCTPPFPEKEALIKVDSAISRALRTDRHWAEEVRAWVEFTSGYFSSMSCYGDLQANTTPEKAAVRMELFRLKKEGVIEPHPSKNGWFRKIEKECEPIDWQGAPENDIPIWLPFDLHKMLRVYPKNILVIAGWKDAGKTTFLLNFMKENMNKYEIHYFSSEMGATEFKLRLRLFKDMKPSDWNFKAHERQRNFADMIRPDAINIIDYIEIVGDQQFMIGKYLLDIHNKLKRGIAFVALQKPFGRDIARGGESSLDKPRLYLAMNPGQIKIISAKNRRGKENPNGLILDFKLFNGAELYPQGFWHREEE